MNNKEKLLKEFENTIIDHDLIDTISFFLDEYKLNETEAKQIFEVGCNKIIQYCIEEYFLNLKEQVV